MESESGQFLNGFYSFYNAFHDVECPEQKEVERRESSVVEEEFYNEYFTVDQTVENPLLGSNLTFQEEQCVQSCAEDFQPQFNPISMQIEMKPPIKIEELDFIYDECDFDWDVNLDSLLIIPGSENQPEDGSSSNFTCLPDLTPLCSDMCNNFVKESSEILNFNQNQIKSVPEFKPFQCSFGKCEKIYAKAAHLKAHLRRHMGEKPYVCTWPNCKWKFSRSDELARHRRSHSGVKPYLCDYCPKGFARSDHLAKHRKVHERKFATGKAKGVWRALPKAKPGRKPKTLKRSQDPEDF